MFAWTFDMSEKKLVGSNQFTIPKTWTNIEEKHFFTITFFQICKLASETEILLVEKFWRVHFYLHI